MTDRRGVDVAESTVALDDDEDGSLGPPHAWKARRP